MRIINVTPGPLYCTYARQLAGGTILQSGQQSSELSLGTIHTPVLQKDLRAGKIALRLSEEDHQFINDLLAYDRREIKIQHTAKKVKAGAGGVAKAILPPASGMPKLTLGEDKLADITVFMGGIKRPGKDQQQQPQQQQVSAPIQTIHTGDGPTHPNYGRPANLAEVTAANAANKRR